jgi:cell division protein FtsB
VSGAAGSERSADRTAGRPSRSWLGIAVVLVLGMLAAGSLKGYRDLAEVRSQESELRRRIAATEGRIRRLDERLERIENDPWTLERLAREELGMVRPGDLVIVLPQESPEDEPPPAPREAGPREAGPREAGPREAGPREAGPRETL